MKSKAPVDLVLEKLKIINNQDRLLELLYTSQRYAIEFKGLFEKYGLTDRDRKDPSEYFVFADLMEEKELDKLMVSCDRYTNAIEAFFNELAMPECLKTMPFKVIPEIKYIFANMHEEGAYEGLSYAGALKVMDIVEPVIQVTTFLIDEMCKIRNIDTAESKEIKDKVFEADIHKSIDIDTPKEKLGLSVSWSTGN